MLCVKEFPLPNSVLRNMVFWVITLCSSDKVCCFRGVKQETRRHPLLAGLLLGILFEPKMEVM
jgi:hypothetical protein